MNFIKNTLRRLKNTTMKERFFFLLNLSMVLFWIVSPSPYWILNVSAILLFSLALIMETIEILFKEELKEIRKGDK